MRGGDKKCQNGCFFHFSLGGANGGPSCPPLGATTVDGYVVNMVNEDKIRYSETLNFEVSQTHPPTKFIEVGLHPPPSGY